MHIKRIHEMVEELTECTLSAIKANESRVGDFAIPDVIDMIKDLCCAEKDAREAKEKEKEEEDEKKENEYFLKMLKEENKDEYKRMREEYGDSEEADRRFYDAWRYKNGRFAPKGRGARRGYEEPPYYHMTLDMMREHDPEYWRDMDRNMGKMYYTDGGSGSQSGSSGMSGGNMGNSGGSTRGYSDGYDDGQRRGYEDGYRDGEIRGRSQGGNSRYEKAKRGYEETKEKHKGNTPEDKRTNMAEFEKVLNIVLDEIDDMLEDAPPEMKNMVKTKGMTRFQKIS